VLGGVISLYAPSRRGLISIVALRARGSALRRSFGRLYGVRFRLPGEGCSFGSCCPAGTAFSPSGEVGTPVRRAARRGRLWGCARQSDAKPATRCLGRHRRYGRRAERHGYQSLTARQSRDLLLISGRVDCVNTPAPLASPRSTPLRFSISAKRRGLRGCSCGSFPHSLRSLR